MLTREWLDQLPIKDIQACVPVSGGDINDAYRIDTSTQRYFLLVQPQTPASFFDHEIEGLTLLGEVALVPTVINSGAINGDAYLLLEWLTTGRGDQHELGHLVASVHQVHQSQFGFDHDVLNTKLPKINTWQTNWGQFYVEQRLEVLAQRAAQNGLWSSVRQQQLNRLEKKILAYYQNHETKPSLLHGDLWTGNYLFTADGKPALIDPDVFYGDRELDLAMTTLFGGFSADFYVGYRSQYPLPDGFEDRLAWYQLYYLLAHLNLFGETYGPAVDRILTQY